MDYLIKCPDCGEWIRGWETATKKFIQKHRHQISPSTLFKKENRVITPTIMCQFCKYVDKCHGYSENPIICILGQTHWTEEQKERAIAMTGAKTFIKNHYLYLGKLTETDIYNIYYNEIKTPSSTNFTYHHGTANNNSSD